MAGSVFGRQFQISTWGESHGKALGVVIDGCPAGIFLSEEKIQPFLDRRKPGQNALSTPRREEDLAEILSGVFEGRTTGTPISVMIRNTSQHSSDYKEIAGYYRPGHADYTYDRKYGFRDPRGGGRSSGRETADIVRAKIVMRSCKAAVKANMRLSDEEARALLDELFSLEDPYRCPHGRPAIVKMSRYEMDKKFKRIV